MNLIIHLCYNRLGICHDLIKNGMVSSWPQKLLGRVLDGISKLMFIDAGTDDTFSDAVAVVILPFILMLFVVKMYELKGASDVLVQKADVAEKVQKANPDDDGQYE